MTARPLRALALLLAGAFLYVLFLIATLPASWMGEMLARISRGAARLQDPVGTVWNGSGALLWSGAGRETLSAPLRWSIQPLWLLAGRVQAQIETRGELSLRAVVAASYRRLRIRALEAEFPAALVATVYAPAALIAPTGVVRIAAPDLELASRTVRGELRVTWAGAGSRFGGLSDVGDYLLVGSGQGDTATLRAETQRGEIQIAGQGSWQVTDGSLRFSGTLAPGSRDASLAPLLQGLGARREADRYVFELNTRLTIPLLTETGRSQGSSD